MSRQAAGLQAWLVQRISAIYLLLFLPFLLATFIFTPPQEFTQWKAWISAPMVSIGILMFFLSLLLHAWVGLRDVLMDYLHPPAIRVGVLTVVGMGLIACGLWAFKIVLLAQFGGV